MPFSGHLGTRSTNPLTRLRAFSLLADSLLQVTGRIYVEHVSTHGRAGSVYFLAFFSGYCSHLTHILPLPGCFVGGSTREHLHSWRWETALSIRLCMDRSTIVQPCLRWLPACSICSTNAGALQHRPHSSASTHHYLCFRTLSALLIHRRRYARPCSCFIRRHERA